MNIESLNMALLIKSQKKIKENTDRLNSFIHYVNEDLMRSIEQFKSNQEKLMLELQDTYATHVDSLNQKLKSLEHDNNTLKEKLDLTTQKNFESIQDLMDRYVSQAKRLDDIAIIEGPQGPKGDPADVGPIYDLVDSMRIEVQESLEKYILYVDSHMKKKYELNKKLQELFLEDL